MLSMRLYPEGAMIAFLVIDMQAGLFGSSTPRYDASGVIQRINTVSAAVRRRGGTIVFVQHDDPAGGDPEPGSPGWELLAPLARTSSDVVVRKTACDAFYQTELADMLERLQVHELVIAGYATDFCVDTTIRAAASRAYDVTVVADVHTTADRPHLNAAAIIEHHNWMWQNLIVPRHPLRVIPAAQLVEGMASWI